MQTLEQVGGTHPAQIVTLDLDIVTRKTVLTATAYTGNHYLTKFNTGLQFKHEVVLILQYLLGHRLISDIRYLYGLLLVQAQTEFSVKISHTSPGTFSSPGSTGYQHGSPYQRFTGILVENLTRDTELYL